MKKELYFESYEFSNFKGFFLKFYGFFSIYFSVYYYLKLKKINLFRVLTWQLTRRHMLMCHHMAMYARATRHMCMCVCLCVRVSLVG